jgi:predicted nucleic acid-binding protein
VIYIETSALVGALLDGDEDLWRLVASAVNSTTPPLASALTFLEAIRAVRRGRAAGDVSAEEEGHLLDLLEDLRERCNVAPLDQSIVRRAEDPFPEEPIRSLDALHVATAVELRHGPMEVLSTDQRVRANARAFGLRLKPSTV